MRAVSATLVFILLLVLPGCSTAEKKADDSPAERRADLKVDARVVTAMNDFGFRLYGELAKKDAAKNLFISPASIELALAMTFNGAQGATKEAMATTLGVDKLTLDEVNAGNAQLIALLQNPDPKVQLAIANSLWGRQGITFKPDFLQRNTQFYQAKVSTLDFTAPDAANTINQWVSDNTRGKIPTLVDADTIRDALLVLINALYFKGEWSTTFDKKLTRDDAFTLADGTKKTLPMMRRTDDFRYFETDAMQAICLPYGKEFVSMYLFLPKEGSNLTELRKSLTASHWNEWMGQLQRRNGTIILPRFKANYEAGLKPALSALGMGTAFGDTADFHGMFIDETLPAAITEAIHKTVLEVNEEGTTAAAATGIIVGVTSVIEEPPPFVMNVNHPFLLAIRDNPTGAVLFLGSIVNPQ